MIVGAVVGVAATILTGGIAALGIGALLTGAAVAGAAALGSLAGKTLSDVLGPNYSAQGKYWSFIIQRTTTRGYIESIQSVFEKERFADEEDWLALMVEVGKQMKCNYTAADVNSALKIVLAMAAGNGDANGTVRKSDYAYAINVGNGTRWFRTNAEDKFFIKISY